MKKLKLGPKIIIASLLILAVVVTAIGAFSFYTYKNDLISEYAVRAISIAELTASSLDSKLVERYGQTGQEDSEYQGLVDQLTDIKARTEAYYLYIIVDTGTEFRYIAEGISPGQTGITWLNDTDGYENYGPEPQNVLNSGIAQASGVYPTEEYGDLISAFAPIKDSAGNTFAVIGMDLSPAEINAAVRNYLVVLIIVLVASMGLTYVILHLMIRAIVTKPVKMLKDASLQLMEGNTNLNVAIKSQDELGELAFAFGAVVNAINGLTGDIFKLLDSINKGDYDNRANIDAYSGEYRKLLDGVNKTVDSFVRVLNQMPSPVYSIDKEYTIRFINEPGAKFLRSTKSELTGMKCYDAFNSSDCRTEKCACHVAMQNKCNAEHEAHAQPTPDLDFDIRYNAAPILLENEVIGAFEVVTDLTDIKKAKVIAEEQAETLEQLMFKVNAAAEQVASGTASLASGSQTISQGATEQAGAIEELSDSLATIAGQIRDNAARTDRARELALEARTYSAEGNEYVRRLQDAMQDINQSSENISKIIKTIDEIAFQTNILALNAAVEAARAGVNGKSFGVVAQEVRNLAVKSAKAAQDTALMIKDSINKVKVGSGLASTTAESFGRILSGSEKSAQFIDEISAATNEQATGIAQINIGIEQLSEVVQSNSATAEQAAAASQELSSQAEMLSSLVEQYKA